MDLTARSQLYQGTILLFPPYDRSCRTQRLSVWQLAGFHCQSTAAFDVLPFRQVRSCSLLLTIIPETDHRRFQTFNVGFADRHCTYDVSRYETGLGNMNKSQTQFYPSPEDWDTG